ncbi:hypothetical protein [Neobacillus cucumis]|uniref:DUF1797 domain-containing protein n=1 Tax=Neobacillus cucumis TaxID=1740721 RepID=A0A2N5HMA3_9BACI|nr:hypothetical protein [Neobacillus cucumis]PLS06649.1 hypothetical protein CVD27_07240 [Neobacillus cucumis]
MSLAYTQILFETMRYFNHTEIYSTFKEEDQTPILSVCFKNNQYEITYHKTQNIELYDKLESVLTIIHGL